MDNHTSKTLPLYAKLSLTVMGLLAFFYIVYIGQNILIPLVFSTIIAILLNPLVNFLTRKKLNRIFAILIALITALVFFGGLIYFIGSQMAMFSDEIPKFKERFSAMFNDIIAWISDSFKINEGKIRVWINQKKGESLQSGPAVIGQTLITISGSLALAFLVPIYIFMILFYKPLLLSFISQLFRHGKQDVVADVLLQTKTLIQSYLVGLLMEMVVVASLITIGLFIIGIEYAILIGVLSALLNLIPYIGTMIATALPMLLAIATKSPVDALWVLGLYIVVQFIDNNIIVPRIVASKVEVNALVSIIVVIIGGSLWGVAGMFLSIPVTAIIKVIFDRVEALKPFGFVIGDNVPDLNKAIFKFKIPSKKK